MYTYVYVTRKIVIYKEMESVSVTSLAISMMSRMQLQNQSSLQNSSEATEISNVLRRASVASN